MSTDARQGRSGGIRRLLARALSIYPAVFVVPGPDIARARGLDLAAAGLRVVATPRHAELLLLVGELSQALTAAAVVVYAQMVRPRLIVALDAGDISPLPPAQIVAPLSQEALQTMVPRLRAVLKDAAWAEAIAPFESEALLPRRRQPKPLPPAAKDTAAHATHAGGAGQTASAMDGAMGGTRHSHEPAPAAPAATSGMPGMATSSPGAPAPAQRPTTAPSHTMGGMGFMSMVRLTQNQPRSADGLPMEWVQAPLGPFFPGLPSGLDLTVMLDGDTVARAQLGPRLDASAIQQRLAGDAAGLPARLERLDPLAPVAYRVLAIRALQAVNGYGPEHTMAPAQLAAIERERAASHLNWLAAFGFLLGYAWLARQAATLQHAVFHASRLEDVAALQPRIERLVTRIKRTPLLERRLRGIGTLDVAAHGSVRGPVARGGKLVCDARSANPAYTRLGFEPIVLGGSDALARLWTRIDEIGRSLELIRAASTTPGQQPTSSAVDHGSGEATVETPRGAATLALSVESGIVSELRLDIPSSAHLELIEPIVLGQELGDALIGVASLDVSPWGVQR